jgi:hypothetical protein
MQMKTKHNIYLEMPLTRVVEDARAGVSLARRALAVRDAAAARRLGIGISAEQQARSAPLVNDKRECSLADSPEERKSR